MNCLRGAEEILASSILSWSVGVYNYTEVHVVGRVGAVYILIVIEGRRHQSARQLAYDKSTSWERPGERRSVADNNLGTGRGKCVFRPMVLAVAAVARLPGGNGRHSALAMAGGASIRAWTFRCAALCWDFGWTGRGTPAPVIPPKRLVVVGFYRYVRNPMYVGFAAGWIGLWVVFGHADPVAIAAAAAVALGVHLFVVLYEEPTLREKFGADYIDYCRNVGRWWPRLRAWDKPQ